MSGALGRVVPVLLLGLFGVSWSAVLVRVAAAPASAVAFWRLALSVLVLLPFLVASGEWRDLRRVRAGEWMWMGVAGGCLSLHLIAWFLSLEYTSVASSTVLVSSHPLFVGLLSALWLRERPDRREWAGIGAALAGALLVGWGDFRTGPDPLRGDLLALAGALGAALYLLVGRRLRRAFGLWSYVAPVYGAAGIVTALYLAYAGVPAAGFDRLTWACLVGLAVGPMLLGHTSFNWALGHVRAYVVSVVLLLEPVGATLLAILLLGRGEVPTPTTLAGGATVLVGVWLSLRARARSRARAGRNGETRPPGVHRRASGAEGAE